MKSKITRITMPTPFPVGEVHAYLLKGDRLSIIDAGVDTPEAKEAMEQGLKNEGYNFQDIEQVILTHHHPDHTGLIKEFDQSQAILGHVNNQPWLMKEEQFFEKYERFFRDLYQKAGVPASYLPLLKKLRDPMEFAGQGQLTGFLEGNEVIPGHEEFRVLETKGHAQSHLSFYRQEDGLLIGGDLLLPNSSSNPLLEPPLEEGEQRPKPFLQYRESLKQCLTMNISAVLPGHGEIIEAPHSLIEERLEKQKRRSWKVLELLETRQLTAYQLCAEIFPVHIKTQFGLTMSETIGQLDYLIEKKWIEAEESEGRLLFASKVKI